MRFLITGINGQLGYDINLELLKRGYSSILSPTRDEMDLTKEEDVRKIIMDFKPDVIFHCAAYTAVDKAEEDKELCYDVNVNGTKYIAKYANAVESRVIYISTDYVFDGTKDGIYVEDDEVCPINYYGKTKYLGEEEVKKCTDYLIARISWVFGINGKNFVKTMLKLSETKSELSVVADQVGSPTYTVDLAKLLVEMALTKKQGIYHITNEEYCSWYEFAKYIFEVNNIDIKVNQVNTSEYKTIAKRPINSKLSKEKLASDGFNRLPSWKNAVERYSRVLKKEGNK